MMLENIIKYPAVFVIGLGAAWLAVLGWLSVAARLELVDRPGGRKCHDGAIPTGGGVAVFLGFHIACAAVFLIPWHPFAGMINLGWWLRFLPLSLGVVLLGLVDDRYGLSPLRKLLGQILAAGLACAVGFRLQNILGVTLSVWLDVLLTIVWFLALMNAFNLIDGMDGLAAGIAFIAAAGIGVSLIFRQSPGDVLLFAGFAGACLGFLRFNYYPARLFLGDTGSLLIGFTLAALTISTQTKGPAIAVIGMPMLAVGVPLFDTAMAVWRRSVRRILSPSRRDLKAGGIAEADREHLHHRLISLGLSQHQVAWLLYGATALLVFIGLVSSLFNNQSLGIIGLATLLATYTIFRHLAWIELNDTGDAILRGLALPVRRNLSLICYIFADLIILNTAWLIGVILLQQVTGRLPDMALKEWWLADAPVYVAVPFVLLVLTRMYSKTWSLAGMPEYFTLTLTLFAGAAAAISLDLLFAGPLTSHAVILLKGILILSMALSGITGLRFFFRAAPDLIEQGRRRISTAEHTALVWAGGKDLALFLTAGSRLPEFRSTRLAGIVSGDEALRGHQVRGITVWGIPDELPSLIGAEKIDTVYVAGQVDEARIRAMQQQVKGTVRWIRWQIREQVLPAVEPDI